MKKQTILIIIFATIAVLSISKLVGLSPKEVFIAYLFVVIVTMCVHLLLFFDVIVREETMALVRSATLITTSLNVLMIVYMYLCRSWMLLDLTWVEKIGMLLGYQLVIVTVVVVLAKIEYRILDSKG